MSRPQPSTDPSSSSSNDPAPDPTSNPSNDPPPPSAPSTPAYEIQYPYPSLSYPNLRTEILHLASTDNETPERTTARIEAISSLQSKWDVALTLMNTTFNFRLRCPVCRTTPEAPGWATHHQGRSVQSFRELEERMKGFDVDDLDEGVLEGFVRELLGIETVYRNDNLRYSCMGLDTNGHKPDEVVPRRPGRGEPESEWSEEE